MLEVARYSRTMHLVVYFLKEDDLSYVIFADIWSEDESQHNYLPSYMKCPLISIN